MDEQLTELEEVLDSRVEEIVGRGYNPIRLQVALEEPDDSHILCDCGEAFIYVGLSGQYICDNGHIPYTE